MKRVFAIVLAACGLSACESPPQALDLEDPAPFDSAAFVAAAAERCRALAGTELGLATLQDATRVERGEPLIGFFRRMFIKWFIWPDMPKLEVPADFCRVTAKLRPEPGSEITAEVWLPEQWNGKLLAVGGGGFNGGLESAVLTLHAPLERGYAGLATDAGHETTESAKFAHDSPQQFVDYGYRANHVAAGFAKNLIAVYYGAPVRRAYFHGCSNGGRDALMEARRFPDDYEGIIAGAPAAGFSKLMTAFAWNQQAVLKAPNLSAKLALIQEAVIRRCDALDGVDDRLLENPLDCPFDPAELECEAGDAPDCLNADEVGALRRIYGGPHLSDGTPIYPGMPVGGEALQNNWDPWIVGEQSTAGAMAVEFFRWMVHGDAQWDLSRFDIDRDYPLAQERTAPTLDSDDPYLTAFAGRGGRLLLYHGWNDAAIPGGAAVDYYENVRETLGPVTDDHVRLFMVPGMMHCAGGVGPTSFDALDALDRWVETGTAPDRLTATEYDPPRIFGLGSEGRVVRTRPLCPWPTAAHYDGAGSTDEAASFSCK
ncbi:MAG TPA: tannase/feruloyl esterase family alpha/beta hydrolase [Pseudomonadales bacterium]